MEKTLVLNLIEKVGKNLRKAGKKDWQDTRWNEVTLSRGTHCFPFGNLCWSSKGRTNTKEKGTYSRKGW